MAKKTFYEDTHRLITVAEARKLIGKHLSDTLSDSEVEQLIDQLDFIAGLALEEQKSKKHEPG